MQNQEPETKQDAQGDCCNVCAGSCRLKSSGWKWSLFTLAVIIVAGLATTTVLAGDDSAKASSSPCAASASKESAGQCPIRAAFKGNRKGASHRAKMQGAAGEAESAEAKACPQTAQTCPAKDAACCAKDAACCVKDAACCAKDGTAQACPQAAKCGEACPAKKGEPCSVAAQSSDTSESASPKEDVAGTPKD